MGFSTKSLSKFLGFLLLFGSFSLSERVEAMNQGKEDGDEKEQKKKPFSPSGKKLGEKDTSAAATAKPSSASSAGEMDEIPLELLLRFRAAFGQFPDSVKVGRAGQISVFRTDQILEVRDSSKKLIVKTASGEQVYTLGDFERAYASPRDPVGDRVILVVGGAHFRTPQDAFKFNQTVANGREDPNNLFNIGNHSNEGLRVLNIDPRTKPDYVGDIREKDLMEKLDLTEQFDEVWHEVMPPSVNIQQETWLNAAKALKPGGTLHVFPIVRDDGYQKLLESHLKEAGFEDIRFMSESHYPLSPNTKMQVISVSARKKTL